MLDGLVLQKERISKWHPQATAKQGFLVVNRVTWWEHSLCDLSSVLHTVWGSTRFWPIPEKPKQTLTFIRRRFQDVSSNALHPSKKNIENDWKLWSKKEALRNPSKCEPDQSRKFSSWVRSWQFLLRRESHWKSRSRETLRVGPRRLSYQTTGWHQDAVFSFLWKHVAFIVASVPLSSLAPLKTV